MQKIQPMEPQRDSYGYWCHPDMPEIETSEQFNNWISSQGLQYALHCLDGDDGIGAEDAQARYVCGAISQPADVLSPRWRWAAPWLGRWARRWVAAGIGCDSTLEVQPPPRD